VEWLQYREQRTRGKRPARPLRWHPSVNREAAHMETFREQNLKDQMERQPPEDKKMSLLYQRGQ
jgi:hypothetical protein